MADPTLSLSNSSEDSRIPTPIGTPTARISRRGPCRLKKRTPRQTRYNRHRKKNTPTSEKNSNLSNEEGSGDNDPSLSRYNPLSSNCGSSNGDSGRHETGSCSAIWQSGSAGSRSGLSDTPIQPLFTGSVVSSKSSSLAVSCFVSRHHLTWDAQNDLLHLLQLHVPLQLASAIPSSVYTFKKDSMVQHASAATTVHRFCPKCYTEPSGNGDSECCSNPRCGHSFEESWPFFYSLSISEQLQNHMKRFNFWESICESKQKPRAAGDLSDISDGLMYRRLTQNRGPLSYEGRGISLVMNTDGVDVFKSSKHTLWPVLFMVNELGFSERRQPKNMILGGLWYAAEKPPLQFFLKPIIKALAELEVEGVLVHPVGVDQQLTVTVHVVCCCCDLPAKAAVQNFVQFNGSYGCGFCEQPGESSRTDGGGYVMTFPYNCPQPKGPLRTIESTTEHAKDAVRKHSVVFGVKGASWLSCLKSFHFINGFTVDYMHCALLGVSKLLITLWIDVSRCRGTLHDIRHNLVCIDNYLKCIQVPSMIRRKPRPLSDFKHWKASEYRSWTLFYAIPILRGVLRKEYYEHFILFAEALWLLLQSTPSIEDITKAEKMLHHFCYKFGPYYGQRYCTANVHLLLHLADSVRHFGPLWSHSAFPFEDANGWIHDLFQGTKDPHKQIIKAFTDH